MQQPWPGAHALSPLIQRIATGQTLGIHLRRGHEVFCRQGSVQLTLAPLARLQASFGQSMPLATGQSWRAPQNIWAQLACIRPGGCLICITPSAEPPALGLWAALRQRLGGGG